VRCAIAHWAESPRPAVSGPDGTLYVVVTARLWAITHTRRRNKKWGSGMRGFDSTPASGFWLTLPSSSLGWCMRYIGADRNLNWTDPREGRADNRQVVPCWRDYVRFGAFIRIRNKGSSWRIAHGKFRGDLENTGTVKDC